MVAHTDIRIGTVVPLTKGASYVRQILPHGFESFQVWMWQKIGEIDLERTGKEIQEAIAGKAVVSSIGLVGNALMDPQCAKDFVKCIDACKHFGCDMINGLAGAIEGSPVPDSISVFKKVWGDLARRAADQGIRIAWGNADMGGTWQTPRFNIAHSPAAWEIMFNELPAENVGLEWEPCHQIISFIDPLPQLRRWSKKIFHIHGKDATVAWDVIRQYGIRGPKPYVWQRTPGFGDTNWSDVISILRMNKWRGCIDIEGWHDPVYKDDLEMTGQVHALNHLKRCRGGEFVPNPK